MSFAAVNNHVCCTAPGDDPESRIIHFRLIDCRLHFTI